jgi:hypothetical protein
LETRNINRWINGCLSRKTANMPSW